MLARSQFSPTLAHVRKVYVLVFFLSEDDPHHPWLSPYERRDHLITSSASAGDRRAAEQRDELATLQLIELHSIPASQGRVGGYRIGRHQSAGGNPLHQAVYQFPARRARAAAHRLLTRQNSGGTPPRRFAHALGPP